MVSNQQFELQRNVERRLEESIQSMLERFLGQGKSIVRATVDLNLRKVEEVRRNFPRRRRRFQTRRGPGEVAQQEYQVVRHTGVASNVPALPGM